MMHGRFYTLLSGKLLGTSLERLIWGSLHLSGLSFISSLILIYILGGVRPCETKHFLVLSRTQTLRLSSRVLLKVEL